VHLQVTPAGGTAGPGFTFQGPWALFRLLDRVRTEPGASPDRSILVFDIDASPLDQSATYTVQFKREFFAG